MNPRPSYLRQWIEEFKTLMMSVLTFAFLAIFFMVFTNGLEAQSQSAAESENSMVLFLV